MPESRGVLLTGAAGGIGRVMTQALLADGHRLAAVDRDAAGLARLRELPGASERLSTITADLTAEDQCLSAIDQAIRRIGPIGAMINNNVNSDTAATAFDGGHMLHKLTLTSAAVLTVPIFPPNC